jgi:predicted enzyme related to lactoylglutathione lyase
MPETTLSMSPTEPTSERADRAPVIVSPVMRHLRVADPARTLAFYRDVLGFEVRGGGDEYGVTAVAEATRGPARIRFTTTSADGDGGDSTPRHTLFLQTDDAATLREEIRARGGEPSDVDEVNWIKMRMFEVRDPDGHALWFGESFHSDSPARRGAMHTIMPELPLDDVAAGVAHYRDVLGFGVNYAQHDIAVMDRDRVRVLLIARTARHGGIGSCYVYVEDADALHAELVARGARVQGAPVSHPWGLRDFHVLDPEGNRIGFGQPFE